MVQGVSMLIAEARMLRTAKTAVDCNLCIWLHFMAMLMLAITNAAQLQHEKSTPRVSSMQAAQAQLKTLGAAMI